MKLCPMRPLDTDYLNNTPAFEAAMQVTQKMGLHHLMGLHCNYNVYLVQQFFSTLAFKGDEGNTMIWMTRDTPCEANFYQFGEILGYDYDGNTPVGKQIGRASCRERVCLYV